MNPCEEFFRANATNPQKVKLLLLEQDRFLWEKLTASVYSPGILTNQEFVCRQLIQPVEATLDGEFTPTAFGDVMNKGLSVNRCSHTSLHEANSAGLKRVEEYNTANSDKPERKYLGLIYFSVSDLRKIQADSRERACAIYDTGKLDDKSHADICLAAADTTANKRSLRAQLFSAAKRLIDLDGWSQ